MPEINVRINHLIILFFMSFLFIIFFFMAVPYYSGDIKNHLVWAESLLNFGPMNFYEREFHNFAFPNYPPLAMWFFVASLKIYQFFQQFIWYLNTTISLFPSNLVYFIEWENVKIAFLKLPAILSNFGIAIGLYLILKLINFTDRLALLSSSIFLLNPASFYLSIIWGQIDLIPVMFLIFAFYFLFKSRVIFASICMILALLSKQTIIIFWPIYLVLLLKKYGWFTFIKVIFLNILLFYLAYLPFHQFSLVWPIMLYRSNFDLVAHSVAENALNLWGLLFNFRSAFDNQLFLAITLNHWGYFLLLILLIPMGYFFLKKEINIKNLLTVLSFVGLCYFFVLTRMHERYLAPSIVFLSILLAINKKYLISLIFFSFLHFINLYRGLLQPDMGIFNSVINSIIFLKVLVVGYFILLIYHLKNFLQNE